MFWNVLWDGGYQDAIHHRVAAKVRWVLKTGQQAIFYKLGGWSDFMFLSQPLLFKTPSIFLNILDKSQLEKEVENMGNTWSEVLKRAVPLGLRLWWQQELGKIPKWKAGEGLNPRVSAGDSTLPPAGRNSLLRAHIATSDQCLLRKESVS